MPLFTKCSALLYRPPDDSSDNYSAENRRHALHVTAVDECTRNWAVSGSDEMAICVDNGLVHDDIETTGAIRKPCTVAMVVCRLCFTLNGKYMYKNSLVEYAPTCTTVCVYLHVYSMQCVFVCVQLEIPAKLGNQEDFNSTHDIFRFTKHKPAL